MRHVQRQINLHRKGAALIQVRDHRGRPWSGGRVTVDQESHQFQFGCLVPDLSGLAACDRQRYERLVEGVFNVVRRADEPHPDNGAEFTVDLRPATERLHLAEIQRRLDAFRTSTESGAELHRKLRVYVSGRTVGTGAGHLRPPCGLSTEIEAEQAKRIASLYTLCFSHPLVGGTYWSGVVDGQAGVGDGGVLRQDFSAKRALKVLRILIRQEWHSRARGLTDKRGEFTFSGYFGSYRVIIDVGAQAAIVTGLNLSAGQQPSAICVKVDHKGNRKGPSLNGLFWEKQ